MCLSCIVWDSKCRSCRSSRSNISRFWLLTWKGRGLSNRKLLLRIFQMCLFPFYPQGIREHYIIIVEVFMLQCYNTSRRIYLCNQIWIAWVVQVNGNPISQFDMPWVVQVNGNPISQFDMPWSYNECLVSLKEIRWLTYHQFTLLPCLVMLFYIRKTRAMMAIVM